MNTKIWTVVGVVAIIAIIGAFAWTQMDHTPAEREVFYDYDVVEVKLVTYGSGTTEYRAETYFDSPLPAGVRLAMSYNGVPLGETETTRDGVEKLSLIIYPTPSMSMDDLRDHMLIKFYA